VNDTALTLAANAGVFANAFGFAIPPTEEFSDWIRKDGMWYSDLKFSISSTGNNLSGIGLVTATNGSTELTGTNFDLLLHVGDQIWYELATGTGDFDIIGTIATITNATTAVLQVAYPGVTLTNQFAFIRKSDISEGERYRGYYIRAQLETDIRTRDVEMYAVNFYINKDELSGGTIKS